MQRSSAKRRIGSSPPMSAILLSKSPHRDQQSRLGFLLVGFLRVVAAIWICEGLAQWSSVIVTNIEGRSEIASLSPSEIVAVIFFAIIDLIASVGLWLGAPWGAVIWLVSVGAQLLVVALMPGFYEYPWLTSLLSLMLVGAYLVLTWQYATSVDQRDRLGEAP